MGKNGKNQMTRILLVVVSTSLLLIILVVINHKSGEFERDLRIHEEELNVVFQNRYQNLILNLELNDKNLLVLFRKRFNIDKATITQQSYFLWKRYVYTYPSVEYLECLENDINVQLASEEAKIKINEKVAALEERFGASFNQFYQQLGDRGYKITEITLSDCQTFLGLRMYFQYREEYWEDIETVLAAQYEENKKAEAANRVTQLQFENDRRHARNQLRTGFFSNFDRIVENSMALILRDESVSTTFNTERIGSWSIKAVYRRYQSNELQRILNNALISQWEDNSLISGSMPYANCFGSANSCSGWNCSKINVRASPQDVIVTVKNSAGRVVRHAYIKANQQFTFNLPNGTYQTFFYSGKGWNPNKAQPSKYCTLLKGGFVMNEVYSKDPRPDNLNNNELTYELRLQSAGNFQTRPSSAQEAF